MKRVVFVILLLALSSYPSFGMEVLRIGLLQQPKTLNIWHATDTWSAKILGLSYPNMFLRDPDSLELVPFLAEDYPKLNLAEKSYTLRLKELRWEDGTPFTSEDVVFTGETILKYKVPHFFNRWELVERIEAIDPRTVKFYLKELSPLFESRTLLSPVVQKKEWEPVVRSLEGSKEPLKALTNHKVVRPVGIGPFVVSEVKEGAYVFMKRNPKFVEHHMRMGPHVQGIIFKIFGTTDTAVLELKKGGIDYIWWNLPEGYLDDLSKEKGIRLYSSEKNALYFLAFDLRRAPMKDLAFRQAVAYLIDKEFIVTRLLQEKGVVMDSVISPGNKQWFCDKVERYGKGLARQERIKKAYQVLMEAGYSWKEPPIQEGKTKRGVGLVTPSGEEVKGLTILVPPADYDPVRAMAGTMIQEWLMELGIDAKVKAMPFSALIDQVKSRREYDMVIMGYGNLSLDPDYMRRFFGSEERLQKGDNITGYSSKRFDELAKQAAFCVNTAERKAIVCEMQRILSQDLPVIPLYDPYMIEAVREDRFKGWVPTLGGVGNIWTFLNLRPVRHE